MVNKKSKEEVYNEESIKFTRYHNILEWLAMALLIVGIITAALDVSFGGFTPLLWFILALFIIVIIICMEVSMIRAFLESKDWKK